MEALTNLQIFEQLPAAGEPHSGFAGSNELALLESAIGRWESFASDIFVLPVAGELTKDALEQVSLEDTDHYLDVKIHLCQYLAIAGSSESQDLLVNVCSEIRKITYHFTTSILPQFAEIHGSLIELVHRKDQLTADHNYPEIESISPDLELSREYKECLVMQRKQIKLKLLRQRSRIRSLFDLLKRGVRNPHSL